MLTLLSVGGTCLKNRHGTASTLGPPSVDPDQTVAMFASRSCPRDQGRSLAMVNACDIL
jgi:hypothetical protein